MVTLPTWCSLGVRMRGPEMKHSTNVTLPDGTTTTWGSARHIAALRQVWAQLTPAARQAVRTTLPAAAQLIH